MCCIFDLFDENQMISYIFVASVAQTYANLSKRLCDRFIY